MALAHDGALIETVVRHRDPSFADVPPDRIESHLASLRAAAGRDDWLLAAMRLVALARNGHSRLIPNPAISVLPLRLVPLGAGVWLTQAPARHRRLIGWELTGVGGLALPDLLARAAPLLAGTAQRGRGLYGLILAWPGALRAMGALAPGAGRVDYTLRGPGGIEATLSLPLDRTVPALTLYPVREHGGLSAQPSGPQVGLRPVAPGILHLRLADLHDPHPRRLECRIARAASGLDARPQDRVILDLRGNPGGNFNRARPLLERLGHRPGPLPVLTDRYTFSAAIVTAAILSAARPDAVVRIGEEMGDHPRFWAEGGTLPLPATGALLRWSDAWHDWQTGQPGLTTPPDIARQMVAAGDLLPHRPVAITAPDLRAGRDPVLAAALAELGA